MICQRGRTSTQHLLVPIVSRPETDEVTNEALRSDLCRFFYQRELCLCSAMIWLPLFRPRGQTFDLTKDKEEQLGLKCKGGKWQDNKATNALKSLKKATYISEPFKHVVG